MSKNKTRHWFRPKSYGYGMTPITWEGWFATAGFVLLLLLSGWINNIFDPAIIDFKDIGRFVYDVLVLSFLFMLVFEKKTTDELKWRWHHPFKSRKKK